MSEPIIIPDNVDIDVGDTYTFNGKRLEAVEHFSQGQAAKNSGLKYFMFNNRGAIGFKELDSSN